MDNESLEPLTRKEHNPDAAAKRVVLRYFNSQDGNWYNYTPDDVSLATAVVSSVSDSASSVQLVAAYAGPREVIITNDSSSTLYVKLGTTASTTSYSVKLGTDDTFITRYRGRIDGIWSADSSGAARITEELL